MATRDLGFVHRFQPSAEDGQPLLLLLHGTGGNEEDLLPLGSALAPRAAMLSPRGKVLENGMPRFFRRLAEGVFDLEDLRFRTSELADFVEVASLRYGLSGGKVVAVGFSNGANIAASLLLLRPGLLAGAILLHPMVPLLPETLPDLGGISVLVTAGRRDQLIPQDQTERLVQLLRDSGADVELYWQQNGHALTQEELLAAKKWMAEWMQRL